MLNVIMLSVVVPFLSAEQNNLTKCWQVLLCRVLLLKIVNAESSYSKCYSTEANVI